MAIFTLGNISAEHDDPALARWAVYRAWYESLLVWPLEEDGPTMEPPKPPDLEHFRSLAQAELTRRRGEARRPYITDTYGQELAYTDKERQARQYQTDASPTPDNYPALYGAESAALGLDAAAMASLILSQAATWHVASDMIEGAVRVAEAGIDAAKMHQEILNILIELDI
jgi:hypothetical protein